MSHNPLTSLVVCSSLVLIAALAVMPGMKITDDKSMGAHK